MTPISRSATVFRLPKSLLPTALSLTALIGGAVHSHAASIAVPNFSFESVVVSPLNPFGADPTITSWQKDPEPAYYASVGPGLGYSWDQLAGVFLDSTPYGNLNGTQGGFMLSLPEVVLFQQVGATFDLGQSYTLTLGVFGKVARSLAIGSTLRLSLYYLDDANARVPVQSTIVTFNTTTFIQTSPLNFVDFAVNVPAVQAADAWLGKSIGIEIQSTTPLASTTYGNWDLENGRLEQVPEPATAGLLGVGLGALLLRRRRLAAA